MPLLLVLLACANPGERSRVSVLPIQATPERLLMVSIDTLRKDRLVRYGGSQGMPWLEARLEEAFVLEEHHSCSNNTINSMTCLMLGRGAIDLGWQPWIDGQPNPLGDAPYTLTERLADHGMLAGLVTTNLFMGTDWGLAQGQHRYRAKAAGLASWAVDETLNMLEDLDSVDRWFQHVHLFDPHQPYDMPDGYDTTGLPPIEIDILQQGARLKVAWPDLGDDARDAYLEHMDAAYDAELAYLDGELQRFFEEAEAAGWLDDTLVLFISDHGEQFFERGSWGHGDRLHPEETAALAAFWAPGLVDAGTWLDDTTHVDIMPTLAHAFDLPSHEWVTGRALGNRPPMNGVHFYNVFTEPQRIAVEQGELRLHYGWDGEKLFYDQADDPNELEDVYAPDRADVQRLWPQVETMVDQATTTLDLPPAEELELARRRVR